MEVDMGLVEQAEGTVQKKRHRQWETLRWFLWRLTVKTRTHSIIDRETANPPRRRRALSKLGP